MDREWPGRWVKVLRPDRGRWIKLTVLGDFIEVPTHWDANDGCVPCWGGACRYCPQKVRARHYAACQHVATDEQGFALKRPGICELFDENMMPLSRRQSTRGLELKIGKTLKGKLYIAEINPIPAEFMTRIDRDFDVKPFLERIFGMTLESEKLEEGDPNILRFRKQA